MRGRRIDRDGVLHELPSRPGDRGDIARVTARWARWRDIRSVGTPTYLAGLRCARRSVPAEVLEAASAVQPRRAGRSRATSAFFAWAFWPAVAEAPASAGPARPPAMHPARMATLIPIRCSVALTCIFFYQFCWRTRRPSKGSESSHRGRRDVLLERDREGSAHAGEGDLLPEATLDREELGRRGCSP